MLRSILLAALPALTYAAPAPAPASAPAPAVDFLTHLSKRADATSSMGQCNLDAIKMDPAGLPIPSSGLVLSQINIGRGSQNYTCANSSSSATPVAIGALATLYNVTCLAGPFPDLLDAMTRIALRFPAPSSSSALAPANLFLAGHHYFTDAFRTPFFNFNTPAHSWGTLGCKKLNATPAVEDPTVNVPNLKLKAKSRDGTGVREVYRLKTQGGQPPKTCDGQPKTFEVSYSAEYWFWTKPGPASASE